MTRKLTWVLLSACAIAAPACFEHHTADETVEIVPPYDDDDDNVDGDGDEGDEGDGDEDPGDEQEPDPEPPRLDGGTTTPRRDAGVDAGVRDAGTRDAGARDAGTRDAGARDAGARDAGARDAGARDAGARDAGTRDAGFPGGLIGGGGNPGGTAAIAEIIQELFRCDEQPEGFAALLCALVSGGLSTPDAGARR
jgi:hypothetical protein